MTTEQLLAATIQHTVDNGGKAFIPYIMAGDGGLSKLKETILFLQRAGVTAIELGIPFSDPVADGPVIQAAGERALADGVTLRKVLQEVATFQDEVNVPLVIMTYLNPVLRYGIPAFVEDCKKSGIKGLIIPDLPLEESSLLTEKLQGTGIGLVQLVSLTSPLERLQRIVEASEGFVYAVTVNGITGEREAFADHLADHFAQLKKVSSLPVLAGFGISTPAQVRSMGALSDGVIVGSAIVDALHRQDFDKVTALIAAAK